MNGCVASARWKGAAVTNDFVHQKEILLTLVAMIQLANGALLGTAPDGKFINLAQLS
jgi:hypothetical protein